MIRFRNLGAALLLSLVANACNGSGGANPPAAIPDSARLQAATTYAFVDLGAGPNGGAAAAQAATKTHQGGNYVYTRDSCGKDCSFNVYHALAWSGSGSTPVDINPPITNFAESWVYSGNGSVLVGMGITNQGGYFGVPHALLWRGSSYAWTDINPSEDSSSYAYGTNGTAIAGSGDGTALHALLWSLNDLQHPVDLHPGSAYTSSEALAVAGTNQAGYATTASSSPTQHAMLWSASAASAVDLTPSGVTGAYAYAIGGGFQGGCGVVSPATAAHALLWQGSAASMKDLNPPGFTDSCIRAVRNGVQAGYGHTGGNLHAVLWRGTPRSAVDLQSAMPSGYTQSQAYAIDASGNIVGSAYATSGGWHGALWMKQ